MQKFAYLNKSYIKDLEYTKTLHKTFQKHYKGNSLFYIAVPKSDLEEFRKHLPDVEIIDEEDIILSSKLNLDDYKKIPGYLQQQIIKLVFHKYKNLENYVTFDSDIIFFRDFNNDHFFKNSKIETFCVEGKPSAYNKNINDFYEKYGNVKTPIDFNKLLFVSGYAMWNGKILDALTEFISKTPLQNFIEMIKYQPVEMEWYGKFCYLFHKKDFIQKRKFRSLLFIIGWIDKKKPFIFKPDELIFMEYYRLTKRSKPFVIGIVIHYVSDARKKETLLDIINKFEKRKKYSLFIFMLIQFLSNFAINKSWRYKFKYFLCNIYINSRIL